MTYNSCFNARPNLLQDNYSISTVADSLGLKVRSLFGKKDYTLELVDNLGSLRPDQKICGDRFRRLISLAANCSTDSLDHALLRDRNFQLFSETIDGAENLQTKKLKAFHKAIYLSFGTSHPFLSYKILEESYWQEALLPTHPSGPEINDVLDIWKASSSTCSFEAHLYKTSADRGISEVKYLNAEERVDYAVEFIDGKLFKNGVPFDTNSVHSEKSNHSAIYAILPDEKLYVGPYILGKFHHSSFNSGQPVLGAGEIMTDAEGVIKSISSKSGHFKPCAKHLLETLKYFEEQKVNLSNVTLIENYRESPSKHLCAEAFLSIESDKTGTPRERMSPKNVDEPFLFRRIPSSPSFREKSQSPGSLMLSSSSP
jgi:hypothetical protein